jgi:hypothetical protein
MARGGVSEYGDVERNVRDGSALLWLAWDGTRIHAAAVTELRSANGRKFCTIVACGGEQRRHWLHLLADLESFARAEGCATVLILGRPGWRRVLPDYRVKNIILEKELS